MLNLHLFNGKTGQHIRRVAEYNDLNWSDSINEPGSISFKVKDSGDVKETYAPWRTIAAVLDDERVIHAGYIEQLRLDNEKHIWTVSGGGGSSILEKRLVLKRTLMRSWKNGRIKVDEKNPSSAWQLSLKGSYSDLIAMLIDETLAWGALPIKSAARTGGNNERKYNSYDYATVLSRIEDICDLENGPELRFDATIDENWKLTFYQVCATEIITHHYSWNALAPDSPIILGGMDVAGDDMACECFCAGGKDSDELLVSRTRSSNLLDQGYPLLQVADKSHSSVSQISTLQSYGAAAVSAGDHEQLTHGLTVRSDIDVRVGDWLDVRTVGGVLPLKVTDVSGGVGKHQSIQARRR